MNEMELMYQNAKMFYEIQKYETAYNLCEDLIKAGCVKAYTLKALILSEKQEKESLNLLKKHTNLEMKLRFFIYMLMKKIMTKQ